MKVALVTGGSYDYLELTAETVSECVSLARVAGSPFLPPRTLITMLCNDERGLKLRVQLSDYRLPDATIQAAVNAAHDSEP